MSTFVLDGSDDPEVRTLARDVQLSQQQQAGQMFGWLEQWGLPQSTSRPAMAWMPDNSDGMSGMAGMDDGSSGGGSGGMPGMAGQGDLERLRSLSGLDAGRLYLQLMIPHHEGGVAMAEVAARQASNPAVQQLAQTVVNSQTAELTVMREMLAARGGPLDGP